MNNNKYGLIRRGALVILIEFMIKEILEDAITCIYARRM
jgi:hypothetical protein